MIGSAGGEWRAPIQSMAWQAALILCKTLPRSFCHYMLQPLSKAHQVVGDEAIVYYRCFYASSKRFLAAATDR